MDFIDSFSSMSFFQIGICLLLGYLGFKIGAKLLKVLCFMGIGFFIMKFIGII